MKKFPLILGFLIVFSYIQPSIPSYAVEDIINIKSHINKVRSNLRSGHQRVHSNFHNARKERQRNAEKNLIRNKTSTNIGREKPEPTQRPTVRPDRERERERTRPSRRYRYPQRYGVSAAYGNDRYNDRPFYYPPPGQYTPLQPRQPRPPAPVPMPQPWPPRNNVEVVHVYRAPLYYPKIFEQVRDYEPSDDKDEEQEKEKVKETEPEEKEKIEILSPNEILLQKGITAFFKYQFTRAEKIFEQLKSSDPDNPHAWILDGLVQLAQSDYDAAHSNLKKGFSIYRQEEEAIPSLSDYYEEDRHFEFQKNRLKRFVEKNPDHSQATSLYLLIQQHSDEEGKA